MDRKNRKTGYVRVFPRNHLRAHGKERLERLWVRLLGFADHAADLARISERIFDPVMSGARTKLTTSQVIKPRLFMSVELSADKTLA